MAKRTGGADLPLHGGRVPAWLAERMAALGRVLVEALVLEYGRVEVLRRLSHPFWFQALGAVMGMDWHSSGITTSVIGALRRGLRPVAAELGIFVLGGRGRASRSTPEELLLHSERLGLDGAALVRASRLTAKVDNAAVQDGFQLYLHGFVLAADGSWVVVQQGMCPARGQARRYHWASEGLSSFVDSPHTGIEGAPGSGPIVNLADARAQAARARAVELACKGPSGVMAALREARRLVKSPGPPEGAALPLLQMPLHHDVRPENVVERRLHGALAAVEHAGAETFEALLLTRGLGPRTLTTLAFVAEVLHGAPSRFSDPARFSLALGGKDGHPFPVPLPVYDDTLRVLRKAIQNARLGRKEALDALARLDRESRRLEATADGPGVAAYIDRERQISSRLGGRTAGGTPGRGVREAPRAWQGGAPGQAAPTREVRGEVGGQLALFSRSALGRRRGPWA